MMADMLFWMTAAALTAIVTLPIVWPLLRRRALVPASREEHDVEVYGAQLSELEADLQRGIIAPAEIAGARAEIGRRLLKSAGPLGASAMTASGRSGGGRLALLAAIVAIVLPGGAILVYAGTGSPGLGDSPLASRTAPGAEMNEMIAAAEARLAANPEDGRGWDVLAPIYARTGQPDKAVTAFANAIRYLGPNPGRLAGYGEALTLQAAGEVTGPARQAFEEALAGEPEMLGARFFLALDESQEGRFGEAVEAWSRLIEDSPPDAAWMELANVALADATVRRDGVPADNAAPPQPSPLAGPTAGDVAAAAELPGDDRQAMVEGMVAGLAERLRADPRDVEGWKRLVRSYGVLGDDDERDAALNEARAVFAEGSPERRELDEFARALISAGDDEAVQ